jgi:uncharacterized membrane protein YbaN (DUF454 family)
MGLGEMREQKACDEPRPNRKRQKVTKILLMAAGTVSLAFAAIGIVLPLIPTTPFLLLTAACYCRSSERMYRWLMNNKWFGEYIRNYREGRGIPLKTKIVAVTVLWATIGFSVFFLVPILAVQVGLFIVAIAVSVHIARLPTFKKKQSPS